MSAFTIVVVLHDSGPELAALLPTLERHAAGAQLIVVDTGSRDDGPRSRASTAPSWSSSRTTPASAPPTTPASPAPATT